VRITALGLQLLFLLGLSACASDQWKAAEAQCHLQAMPLFPVVNERRWVNELPAVPPMQKCMQLNYKDKDGNDRVRTECAPVPIMALPRLETFDLNQRARNDYVRSCTLQSCFASYGNTECKPASVEPPPKH
jgi:hypothetical protein